MIYIINYTHQITLSIKLYYYYYCNNVEITIKIIRQFGTQSFI